VYLCTCKQISIFEWSPIGLNHWSESATIVCNNFVRPHNRAQSPFSRN